MLIFITLNVSPPLFFRSSFFLCRHFFFFPPSPPCFRDCVIVVRHVKLSTGGNLNRLAAAFNFCFFFFFAKNEIGDETLKFRIIIVEIIAFKKIFFKEHIDGVYWHTVDLLLARTHFWCFTWWMSNRSPGPSCFDNFTGIQEKRLRFYLCVCVCPGCQEINWIGRDSVTRNVYSSDKMISDARLTFQFLRRAAYRCRRRDHFTKMSGWQPK